MSELDPAVEAIITVLHTRDCGDRCEPHTYAATYLPTAEAILTAAAPLITAQATAMPVENLQIINGYLVQRGAHEPDYPAGPEYGAYPDSDAEPLVKLDDLPGWPGDAADLRASRDEWASRMMEFAEVQQALAELRARIEALRDEWHKGAQGRFENGRHPGTLGSCADALDSLIGGA